MRSSPLGLRTLTLSLQQTPAVWSGDHGVPPFRPPSFGPRVKSHAATVASMIGTAPTCNFDVVGQTAIFEVPRVAKHPTSHDQTQWLVEGPCPTVRSWPATTWACHSGSSATLRMVLHWSHKNCSGQCSLRTFVPRSQRLDNDIGCSIALRAFANHGLLLRGSFRNEVGSQSRADDRNEMQPEQGQTVRVELQDPSHFRKGSSRRQPLSQRPTARTSAEVLV